VLILFAQIQLRAVGQGIALGAGAAGMRTLNLGPGNADFLVVPGHTPLVVRVLEIVALVAELRLVAKHQEAMGKAPGDQELLFALLGQLHTLKN